MASPCPILHLSQWCLLEDSESKLQGALERIICTELEIGTKHTELQGCREQCTIVGLYTMVVVTCYYIIFYYNGWSDKVVRSKA